MVSILPSARTPFDVLGTELGRSLQGVVPQGFQRGFERGQSLNAIEQLQKDIANYSKPQVGPNGEIIPADPSKLIGSLMRAHVLSPGLERSGLGTKLLEMAMGGQIGPALQEATGGGGIVPPGQQTQPSPTSVPPISKDIGQQQPSTTAPATVPEGKKTAEDIADIANQNLGILRPDLVNPATQYGQIATFDSEIKQDLTPNEEAALRQQLTAKYKNPDIVNQVVGRIREGIKNKYNEALAKYGFDKEKLAQIKTKWDTFTQNSPTRLKPHFEKYGDELVRTKEDLLNKYNQYAGSFPVTMTPEQMHTNAMALLQNDMNKVDALHAIPSMPPVRNKNDVSDWVNTNRNAYKDLANQGFVETLREDAIQNKDLGNEEFHELIWGDQTNKNLLNEMHGIKAPKEYSPTGIAHEPYRYNKNYPEEKEKYLNNLSEKLRKLGPNDDLILARAMVLDSDGNIKDFGDALAMAQAKGLKLSPFQQSQLQEINIPRVPPLWELFSEKRFTMPALKAWAPWINYIRGKK